MTDANGSGAMLNAKALSDLLTQNRDDRLCKSWCIMTTNGMLLANSRSKNITELRRQVAISAMTWQEHSARSAVDDRTEGSPRPSLLIIETTNANVLIRELSQDLLLVLHGGVPPRRPDFGKRINMQAVDKSPSEWRVDSVNLDSNSSSFSSITSSRSSASTSVLEMQRSKLEALSEVIVRELQGFRLPKDLR